MIKLIASDLDGTLIHGETKGMPERALTLIHKLTQKGIRFIVASGRQYDNEVHLFDSIKDEVSYIAENGSLCMHQGEVIFQGSIDDSIAFRIVEEVLKNPSFHIVLSRQDTCIVESRDPEFVDFIVNGMKNTTMVVDDLMQAEGPVLKISICNRKDSPEVIDAYLKHLQSLFGSEIKIVTSGNIWIDVLAPSANKGRGLEAFLDLFQIAPEECIAFGDQYNDVEMLQVAGTGYAMSTAAPGIDKYADHVIDSVEDVLEQLLAELEEKEAQES